MAGFVGPRALGKLLSVPRGGGGGGGGASPGGGGGGGVGRDGEGEVGVSHVELAKLSVSTMKNRWQ